MMLRATGPFSCY